VFNTSHLQSLTNDVELSRIPPSELCPLCFAEGSETVFVCFDGNFQLTTLGTTLEKREGISPTGFKDKRIFDEKEPNVCPKSSETDYSLMNIQQKQQKHWADVEISRHLLIQRNIQGIKIQVCFLQPARDTRFLLAHIIFLGGWANDSSNRNCYLKGLWLILSVPQSWYGQQLRNRLQ